MTVRARQKSEESAEPITVVRRKKGKQVKVVVNDSKIARRMLALKTKERTRTSGIRKKHLARYARDMKQVNWEEVEDGFLNGIKTDSPEWKHLHEVVSRSGNDREQRLLLKKLGREFGKIYQRYRRSLERGKGRPPQFKLLSEELWVCKDIARYCVLRNLHPKDFLKYWDGAVKKFSTMEYPPLAFLCHLKRVDQALAAGGDSSDPKERESPRPVAAMGHAAPRFGDSFGDTSRLLPGLRSALESAGFPTQKYNDAFLLTVQVMAHTLARGKKFFLPPGQEKKMAMWLAENFLPTVSKTSSP